MDDFISWLTYPCFPLPFGNKDKRLLASTLSIAFLHISARYIRVNIFSPVFVWEPYSPMATHDDNRVGAELESILYMQMLAKYIYACD